MTLTVKQLKKSSFIAMFISISNIPWNSEFYNPVQLIPSSRMCCWHRKTKLECNELSFAAQTRLCTLITSNNIMVTPYRIYLLIIVIWYSLYHPKYKVFRIINMSKAFNIMGWSYSVWVWLSIKIKINNLSDRKYAIFNFLMAWGFL